jgi:chorismate synthase
MQIESDTAEILSGVRHGKTLGSPVTLVIRNRDHENWADVMSPDPQPAAASQRRALRHPRPGHADLAGALKYLTTDLRDVVERASARETAARVAAGSLARALLHPCGVELRSHVLRIGRAALPAGAALDWERLPAAEASPVRCADPAASEAMIAEIDAAKRRRVHRRRRVRGRRPRRAARWARSPSGTAGSTGAWPTRLMSIQAVKAVSLGHGAEGGETRGSAFHDEILFDDARGLHRGSNHAPASRGGVSNGEEIRASAVVVPIPTLLMPCVRSTCGAGSR